MAYLHCRMQTQILFELDWLRFGLQTRWLHCTMQNMFTSHRLGLRFWSGSGYPIVAVPHFGWLSVPGSGSKSVSNNVKKPLMRNENKLLSYCCLKIHGHQQYLYSVNFLNIISVFVFMSFQRSEYEQYNTEEQYVQPAGKPWRNVSIGNLFFYFAVVVVVE